MDVRETHWYQNKLTAIFGVLVGLLFSYLSYLHYESAKGYRALPQQVFLNIYNQPIGEQNLLKDSFHNPLYRKGHNGETPADFLKEAMLSLFKYNKKELNDGTVLKRFYTWCSEDEVENLYKNIFVNLGQQRIVLAQNGIVEARLIGEFEYIGQATRPYESVSGMELNALTHKFTGKILITAFGDNNYPTVYSVTVLVQRALLQDKIKGYQIIDLEMR